MSKKNRGDTLATLRWFRDKVGAEIADSIEYQSTMPASVGKRLYKAGNWVDELAHIYSGTGHSTVSFCGSWDVVLGGRLATWFKGFDASVRVVLIRDQNGVLIDVGDDILVELTLAPFDKDDVWSLTVWGTPAALLRKADLIDHVPTKREKKAPQIGLLSKHGAGLAIRDVEVKNPGFTDSDLDLYYGEGFAAFHGELVGKLTEGRSGISVFHGPPGGGKTTYIRHLVRALQAKKRVVLVPRSIIEVLGTPQFVELLIEMRDKPSVLVVEDAEEIVTVESRSNGSAASTLLNITDGILNDIAGTQVILTFNCPIEKADPAIMRAGRLVGRRHFGPLSAQDARRLASQKGIDVNRVTGPTMLCDLLCDAPVGTSPTRLNTVGFRSAG